MKWKKVRFLQWYHHTTVMLFCWLVLATKYTPGLWFAMTCKGVDHKAQIKHEIRVELRTVKNKIRVELRTLRCKSLWQQGCNAALLP